MNLKKLFFWRMGNVTGYLFPENGREDANEKDKMVEKEVNKEEKREEEIPFVMPEKFDVSKVVDEECIDEWRMEFANCLKKHGFAVISNLKKEHHKVFDDLIETRKEYFQLSKEEKQSNKSKGTVGLDNTNMG